MRNGGKTMDMFDTQMQALAKMSKEDQAKTISELMGMCICPSCPTYNACAKNAKEGLYCALGKSFMCISEEKGCNCPTCPVKSKMGLKYKSFCTRGQEQAQRYEHTVWGASLNR
jgi:hypothetical protein